MKVKFKRLHENAVIPTKATKYDSCEDLVVVDIEKQNENRVICHLGFSTEIPIGYKGVIVPRSSITKTLWSMLNSPGQIDSGYRGEWQVRFTYIGNSPGTVGSVFPFFIGDRVAQVYFEKVEEVEWEEVSELGDSDRGDGGFGSTGNK